MQCTASVPGQLSTDNAVPRIRPSTAVPGSACIHPRTAERRQCSVPHSPQDQAANFCPSYTRGQKGKQLFMVEQACLNLSKRLPQNLGRVEGRLGHWSASTYRELDFNILSTSRTGSPQDNQAPSQANAHFKTLLTYTWYKPLFNMKSVWNILYGWMANTWET